MRKNSRQTTTGALMYSILLQQWRETEYAARAAEARILEASLQALDDGGEPASLDDRVHATNLRAAANTLLEQAMSDIHAKVSMMSITRDRSDAGEDAGEVKP